MWPRKQCVLRLGRHDCQLWLRQGRQMQLLATQELQSSAPNTPYEPLRLAIQHLAPYVPDQARVQVIADSHWLPALLLDTGRAPLTETQVDALAMHRFTEARGEATRSWQFMSAYRAGERKALAFGCPPQLRQAVSESLAEHLAPAAFAGLQPTLNWAMSTAYAKPSGQAERCTVLSEQDRSLMVFSRGQSLLGFHSAAPVVGEPQHLMRDTQLLSWRCGVPAKDWHFHVLSFDAPPRKQSNMLPIPQLTWTSLASTEVQG